MPNVRPGPRILAGYGLLRGGSLCGSAIIRVAACGRALTQMLLRDTHLHSNHVGGVCIYAWRALTRGIFLSCWVVFVLATDGKNIFSANVFVSTRISSASWKIMLHA